MTELDNCVEFSIEKLPLGVHLDKFLAQNLILPGAIAVYVYLKSNPKMDTPLRQHLKKKFRFGETRLKKALKYLRECGLYEVVSNRSETGNFISCTVVIHSVIGKENQIINANRNLHGDYTDDEIEWGGCEVTHINKI